MIGMLGLSIDLGKVFITKNELQTFVDASALAAALQLDGTNTGVEGANATATAGPLGTAKPNGYNLDTMAISGAVTGYSSSFTGTYDSYGIAHSTPTNTYRFVSITATANVQLSFLPVIGGIPTSMAVSASATAGQEPQSTISSGGLLPFAPDAHDPADTRNFGFTPGSEYTLKWGNNNDSTCAGDAGFAPPGNPPSEHGFVDIGEGNSNSRVRTAITSGGYPNANSSPSSITTGDVLGGVPGNRGSSIFDALQSRVNQDSDFTSSTWAQYKASNTGNGRRVVTVAIVGTWSGNGNNAAAPVLGFANFFLETSYSGNSGSACAIYVGPGNLSGFGSGGTDGTKVYTNVLYK
jgi:Flp pilus assembly protein TadG